MIVKQSLAKSNGIEFGKKWSSPPSMCKGVLGLAIQESRQKIKPRVKGKIEFQWPVAENSSVFYKCTGLILKFCKNL